MGIIEATKRNYQVETLETEIKKFANSLPYWAKYLASEVLSGNSISGENIDTAYSYLLEELKLIEKSKRPNITINYNMTNLGVYKPDLFLTKLENIEGVNALIENQLIEFNQKVTIIYGTNGSGKSSYARLLKQVFYSKAPEEILKNIHINTEHKAVNAKFTFTSNNTEIILKYSDKNSSEFEQFSVFDGKGLFRQLTEKNEFEFRPAGLRFFSDYTNSIIRVEQKLDAEIATKSSGNTADDLSALFDGDSEIKTVVSNLNAQTNISDLKKYTPYSDNDKIEKEATQKQYDELLLASKNKEKQIQYIEHIKKLLSDSERSIENLNKYFERKYLLDINNSINDALNKESVAKSEGLEDFKTDKIEGIGTKEWKDFIVSAKALAEKQEFQEEPYPENNNNCLLCHQPLSEYARKLIANYWIFIKSTAEENAKKSQKILDKIIQDFERLNFDLFPSENTLTVWLEENHPNILKTLRTGLSKQQQYSVSIISNIKNKKCIEHIEAITNTAMHVELAVKIEELLKVIQEDKQLKELEKLLKSKIFLEHKEKFNIHFKKFESFVNNQIWLERAKKANFAKRKITETEKSLSNKYFNQKYVDNFNHECQQLNGDFDIEINHTGSAGKSYRQLKLKGRNPSVVLSEGEQKVIAIADFLTEIQLSEVNQGIILDDPVTSLDETRKSEIAKRLIKLSTNKQIIIFTHDLVFVSSLINYCSDLSSSYSCHWVENRNGNAGQIWLNNSPAYEKEYRNSEPAKKHYISAKKEDCPPMQREYYLKSGFAALRTCYEVLVINDLFKNVVQRFNERVSVDSLSSVYFDSELIEELQDSFAQCCRYMEGHSHSDKYAYKKPEPTSLNEEIQRYDALRTKLRKSKKPF